MTVVALPLPELGCSGLRPRCQHGQHAAVPRQESLPCGSCLLQQRGGLISTGGLPVPEPASAAGSNLSCHCQHGQRAAADAPRQVSMHGSEHSSLPVSALLGRTALTLQAGPHEVARTLSVAGVGAPW